MLSSRDNNRHYIILGGPFDIMSQHKYSNRIVPRSINEISTSVIQILPNSINRTPHHRQ